MHIAWLLISWLTFCTYIVMPKLWNTSCQTELISVPMAYYEPTGFEHFWVHHITPEYDHSFANKTTFTVSTMTTNSLVLNLCNGNDDDDSSSSQSWYHNPLIECGRPKHREYIANVAGFHINNIGPYERHGIGPKDYPHRSQSYIIITSLL